MDQLTKRTKIQNSLKFLSSYIINTIETTEDKLKAVEHMQEFFENEYRSILKGDSTYDRCQYCGEKENLQCCEYCTVVYCTTRCISRHDNKGCIKNALDSLMDQFAKNN